MALMATDRQEGRQRSEAEISLLAFQFSDAEPETCAA